MKKIKVMINGLPGNMAKLIEVALSRSSDLQIIPSALTGQGWGESYQGETKLIKLYEPKYHEEILKQIVADHQIIAIDFTQPDGVEKNVRLYCDNNIPFVMGTTGGNREVLPKLVEASNISAVIAPNMSAPIVMFMNMIEFAAKNYPGVLKDWKVRITESHQAKKKDKSGTALAVGKMLETLGVNFRGLDDIRAVRDQIEQRLMGIPEFALNGHGWHTYDLISPDGKVVLGFKHNINGRDTYVTGTLMALDFLAKQVAAGVKGKCFSMKDVMMG